MNIVLDRASYIFDPSSQTIEFLGEGFDISRLKLITNTLTQEIIYNFADATAGNGGVSGNLLSLLYDTTAMSATDPLQVIVDIDEYNVEFTRVGGLDPNGHLVGLRVNERGHIVPSDQEVVTRNLDRVGSLALVETTGYNSVVVQLTGTGGTGGSGIVVFRYLSTFPDAVSMTGGTKTTQGIYTVYSFLGDGSITF
jgi:hypothetical protein